MLGTIGFVLVAFWTGKLIQWLDLLGKRGLKSRTEKAYTALHSILASTPHKFVRPEVASTFALFTDLQTYLDQRSYAYARRSLGLIERNLRELQSHASVKN